MKYEVKLTPLANEHLKRLAKSEPAAHRKVEKLLGELREHPRTGMGKPKPLSGNMTGQWSRRIADKHRLVYAIDDDKIIVLVLTAAGHYDD
ncbi:hypothetical protein FACS1894201_04140 [Bacteroidia bacterium]|nr:hypothetical protein FACS1894201_04140 [Bacteroidia bacterium]